MKLSDAIKDGQAHMVTLPHRSGGVVEWPILDQGPLERWHQMASALEAKAEELRTALDDLRMEILEAGWAESKDEQWVRMRFTPDQMAELDELLIDEDIDP